MAQTSDKPVKIFQYAKRLNISHKDIINFLDSKGIPASINTKLEVDLQEMLNVEFASDAKKVDIIKSEREKLAEAAEEIKKKVELQKKNEENARTKAEEYRVQMTRELEETERQEAERKIKEDEAERLAEIESKKTEEAMKHRLKAEEEAQIILEKEE
ncbi:MAG: translation initiation factor IF-2 N-terminal domain-containing protein, partial [Candidatus Marinimicrobia bacterium]|nr:translation initiation factor IF-2 N-terminal domain-containing protein [Candidatus Neomarinimicrobiota bacterium]